MPPNPRDHHIHVIYCIVLCQMCGQDINDPWCICSVLSWWIHVFAWFCIPSVLFSVRLPLPGNGMWLRALIAVSLTIHLNNVHVRYCSTWLWCKRPWVLIRSPTSLCVGSFACPWALWLWQDPYPQWMYQAPLPSRPLVPSPRLYTLQ